jgi:hypothetical protein
MPALITVFSTPKPFTNPHIAMIQSNAIGSWMHLGKDVDALLIGEERGVSESAQKQGIRLIKAVTRNQNGTPMVSSIFRSARENSSSPLLAYVNADILLTPDFIQIARDVFRQTTAFLMVGRRWDLDIDRSLTFTDGWVDQLDALVTEKASLHPAGGSDYFIFPRDCFIDIPDLAIGRAGWDNWMIYEARRKGWPVVDASQTYKVIHQQHDYSHLPGGKPHYRHPESNENVRLAGGPHVIYTLADATHELHGARLVSATPSWKKIWREVEIFPATVLKSRWLAGISYAFFHPKKTYWSGRIWLNRKRRERKE